MTTAQSTVPSSADVVIVGAGMAGLYAAWRLLSAGERKRIVILESLARTGGRLETDHIVIDGTSIKTEEGGMRFLSSHTELMSLLETLGLSNQIVDFPMGDAHNVYYLRGKRFTMGEATADPSTWGRLYSLDAKSAGQQPGNVLKGLLTAILEQNHVDPTTWQATPDAWTTLRTQYTYRGIPTCQWGFWAMLTDYGLSTDCIEMLYQSSGFIAPYDQDINAGCALQLLVDFVDPAFHTLGPGYQTLPDALVADITSHGATIHLEHTVTGLERAGADCLCISATRPDGTRLQVETGTVVLAVTQLALQTLIPFVSMFRESERFTADVDSVTDMGLGKINLYYEQNWWTPATGITSGGSFTDLPLAQFYCFANQGSQPGGPASITLYTDYYRTAYWAQLQALGEPYSVANGPQLPASDAAASTFVVEQATRQLLEMFGLASIPAPIAATYRRWGVPGAGDGDHQWRRGSDDREVRARLANPFPHVYICGESYSDDQAWVNGALRSVDQMLAAHFGMPAR